MEFNEQGLALERLEARDLWRVAQRLSMGMRKWGPTSQIVRDSTEDEQNAASHLKEIIPLRKEEFEETGYVTIDAEHFPAIQQVAELALANSQQMVTSLCQPLEDDYYRHWRPYAYHVLAMTAEISEGIYKELS